MSEEAQSYVDFIVSAKPPWGDHHTQTNINDLPEPNSVQIFLTPSNLKFSPHYIILPSFSLSLSYFLPSIHKFEIFYLFLFN